MRKPVYWESVARSVSPHILEPSRVVRRWPSGRKWELDLAGRCQAPRTIERHADPERQRPDSRLYLDRVDHHMTAIMHVRCRKCETCLKARADYWRLRALAEVRSASRTWLGTLTVAPEWRYTLLAKARKACAVDGVDYDRLDAEEQFLIKHQECARHITLWLKRVRKNSGAPLRYFAVAEAHASGDPHYHLLIHEMDRAAPVRQKVLGGAWTLGFSSFSLLRSNAGASYACKYIAKSSLVRVRASIKYGITSSDHNAQAVEP